MTARLVALISMWYNIANEPTVADAHAVPNRAAWFNVFGKECVR
jgi:hypothetical protein